MADSPFSILSRKPEMKEQFSAFMEKLFKDHHADEAPPLHEDEECWFLPLFKRCSIHKSREK